MRAASSEFPDALAVLSFPGAGVKIMSPMERWWFCEFDLISVRAQLLHKLFEVHTFATGVLS